MRLLLALLVTGSLAFPQGSQAKLPSEAVAISLDARGALAVERIELPAASQVLQQEGLIVWPDSGRDRWITLPAEQSPGNSPAGQPTQALGNGGTRGEGVLALAGQAMFTARIDQLLGGEMLRVAGEGRLLVPSDGGAYLSGALTLVRGAAEGDPPLPTQSFTLRHRGGLTATLVLPAGADRVAWEAIESLPEAWSASLPPGDYLLRPESGGGAIRFAIADEDRRDAVLRHASKLAELIESTDDPLRVQVEVEAMLSSEPPYPADALARLEATPEESLTTRLVALRDDLRNQLSGRVRPKTSGEDDTGMPSIDLVRQQIALGQWSAAGRTLSTIGPDAPEREQALAELYAAVLAAESGPASAEEANGRFYAATDWLREGQSADRFRVAMNHAEYLLGLARDSVYNASVRAASNSPTPLYTGLVYWLEARRVIDQALEHTDDQASRTAAARLMRARLDTLLADYLSAMLGQAAEGSIAQAARQTAEETLEAITGPEARADASTRAAAYELLAQIAHRRGLGEACRRHAEEAIGLRLDAGSLAGVESGHRLVAMSLLQQATAHPDEAEALNADALQRLKLSQALSELLRTRFPADRLGLSRAGFLAKRAYVNDKLVDLLVSADKPREALLYAELAKARALEDYLATQGVGSPDRQSPGDYLEEKLAAWPSDLVALEYFVGADRAQVFLITGAGVQAQMLVDEDGTPLDPTKLVAEVRALLDGMDHAARKLSSKIAAGQPADASWQDRLAWLYDRLVPPELSDQLSETGTLLVVPHHVLHYLPFAALVTERDDSEREFYQVPEPKYLIDRVEAITAAPSLSAYWRLAERTNRLDHFNGFGRSTFLGAPPLPGVETDLATLSRIFADRLGAVRSGEQTDESDLIELLGDPGALLVGTHGQNVASAPLLSYLRCGRGAQGDGLLQAGELYTGQTRAPLVILSACYSGLADQAPMQGDDLFGLRRALLQSGSVAVVSGAWDVFDRTGAALMDNFLSELADERPVAAALAEAQRKFLKTEREGGGIYSHPYFWSVLTLTGSDRLAFKPAK